ncbi:DnaA N-terminal domain-containing protein [Roseobacter sp. HKCCA0434]|uniref:DnaA N-terminal domain-containing protein n=1 Tax=Roseobacter sp. HKCCA0434 TaxID=3079297 RepID=UPI002905AD58|nr:DnaA N-terminal domain-containing protein [Roseobacter sp. HKCCA0434]
MRAYRGARGYTGPQAPERKYDLITALGAWGMARGGRDATLALRLITLVTARYNWKRDELSCGQAEIASLWSVDPRTVKREIARLRDLGFLSLIRQGARGRVAQHRLETSAILAAAQGDWLRVGPDFAERMGQGASVPMAEDQGNVVSFPGLPVEAGDDAWGRISARLAQENPHVHASWIAPLKAREVDGILVLRAPTRYHTRHVETHLLTRIKALSALPVRVE